MARLRSAKQQRSLQSESRRFSRKNRSARSIMRRRVQLLRSHDVAREFHDRRRLSAPTTNEQQQQEAQAGDDMASYSSDGVFALRSEEQQR